MTAFVGHATFSRAKAVRGMLLAVKDNNVYGARQDSPSLEPTVFCSTTTAQPQWSLKLPGVLSINSLIVCGDKVVASGPIKGADGAMAGRLWLLSATDGSVLGQLDLPAAMRWDGLAVAGSKLFAALADGTVVCLSSQANPSARGTP